MIVWLGAAAEPGQSSGGFWHDRRQRPTHRVPWTREDAEDREALWRECACLDRAGHAVPVPAPTRRAPIGGRVLMARYTASIETPRLLAETFAYLQLTVFHNAGVGSGRRRGAAAR